MSMAWVAAGVAVAGSLASSQSAAKSQMGAASDSAKSMNISLEKQYLHSIVRNSYKAGLLNTQLGLQKKKAAQEGYQQTVEANALLGLAQASAAATGSIGGSVDAVQGDISMKLGEAQAVSADNYEQMLDNYNAELQGLKINATAEVISQDPAKVSYNGPSTGSMFASALAAGFSTYMSLAKSPGLRAGNTAAGSKFSLKSLMPGNAAGGMSLPGAGMSMMPGAYPFRFGG